MMDNATNNDTFVNGIEKYAQAIGATFNALWGRLRCLPHTIHLAAIKVSQRISIVVSRGWDGFIQLLEAVRAISGGDAEKAASQSVNYQDSVAAAQSDDINNNANGQGDDEEHAANESDNILPAIKKVMSTHIETTWWNWFLD